MTAPPPIPDRDAPPPLPAGAAPPVRSPLSDADYALLGDLVSGRRPVRRAAAVALSSAVTELVVAALAIVVAAFVRTPTGFIIAGALTVIGLVEYAGYRKMRRGEPSAAAMLAANQVALFIVIAIYCGARIAQASALGADDIDMSTAVRSVYGDNPDLAQSLDSLIRSVFGNISFGGAVRMFYGLVVVLSVGFQGGMAVYYFTRRRMLAQSRRETPPWAERLFRELGI